MIVYIPIHMVSIFHPLWKEGIRKGLFKNLKKRIVTGFPTTALTNELLILISCTAMLFHGEVVPPLFGEQ